MADLGEGPGGPVSPLPPLSLGKKKRKAGRASDKKKTSPPPFSSRSGFATDTGFFGVVSIHSVIGSETRPISYKTKINLVFVTHFFPRLRQFACFQLEFLFFFLDIFVFPYPTVKRSRWILICPHVTEPW